MPSEKLQVVLELTASQYKREAREAASATGQIGDAAQRSVGGTDKLTKGLLRMGAAIGIAGLGKFAFDAIQAASSLEESINAVNVVFGEAADKIHAFGESSVDAVGLASSHVNEAATVMGSALINVGFSADEAADKTIELTTRAADMASVFNTEVPEALEAIQSALRGESNPIEKFGVSLTAAAVDAEAAALGYKKVGGEFDTTAKAAARLSIIMQQTERVSGDFANTADSTANTMKRLKERFVEMQGRIGQALMPAFKSLLNLMESLGPVFESTATSIAAMVSEVKPLIDAIAFLREEVDKDTESQNMFVRASAEATSAINLFSLATGDFSSSIEAGLESRDAFINDLERIGSTTAGGSITDLNTAVREAPAAMVEAAEGTDTYIGSLERLFPKVSTAAEKYQQLASGIRSVISAQLALVNPVVAAVQAQDRETAAAEDLQAVKEDSESTTRDIATAELDWAVASAEATAAQELLREQGIGRTVDAMREMTDGPLTDVLDMLRALELISEEDIKIILDVDARIGDQLRSVLPYLEDGRSEVTTGPSGGSGVRPRQHGGPVRAGQPYLVGERGPELMVPQQSGMVMPNGWSRPNVAITIPSTGYPVLDAQLATITATVVTMVEVQN